MKRFLSILLVVVLLFAMVGCKGKEINQPENLKAVNIDLIKKQDLGNMMPRILFTHEGKVAFWGTFGFFVLNGEDGSIYRSLNLEAIDHNHFIGEYVTRFLISEDFNKIYIYNEGENNEIVGETYFYYNIEEDVLREIPVSVEVSVLPDLPVYSMEIAGGEQEGYSSNAAYLDENTVVYLNAADWKTIDLNYVKYDIKTGEREAISLFK